MKNLVKRTFAFLVSTVVVFAGILSVNAFPVMADEAVNIQAAGDLLESGNYELSAALNSFSEKTDSAHWHEAVFVVDADAKTIHTLNKEDGAEKGTGTYSFDDETGVYTLTYNADTTSGNGKTTTFTYADEAITFIKPIYYGVARLNLVDENDEYVPYTAYLISDSGIDETEDPTEEIDTTGKLLGSATVVNASPYSWSDYGVTVAVGTDSDNKITDIGIAEFTDTDDGMHFYDSYGNKALNGQDGDKGIADQLVGKSADEVCAMTESDIDVVSYATCSSLGVFNAVKDAVKDIKSPETAEPESGSASDTLNGVYKAVIKKQAMGNEITYEISVELKDGKYTYNVRTNASAMNYDETETTSGSYTKSGNNLLFTPAGEDPARIKTAVASDDGNTLNANGRMSSFAFSDEDFTLTKADKSETDTNPDTEKPSDDNKDTGNTDDTDKPGDNDGNNNTGNTDTPSDEGESTELISGTYSLTEESYDDSAPMKMPVDIDIDVDAGTFKVTNKNGEAKGSGTISYDEKTGIYTMTYTAGVREDNIGKTSTFTYKNKAITFVTPILIGNASMNIVDENGNFIPYTAKLTSGGENSGKDSGTKTPLYQFAEGGNGTVAAGNAMPYTIRVRDANGSGEFAKFVSVEMDGNVVDPSNYDKSEGSVVIKLKGAYMKTLPVGVHTVKVNFTDGSVQSKLTVRSASGKSSSSNKTTVSRSGSSSRAKTGDESNTLLFIIIAAVAACAICAASLKIKADSKK